MLIRILCAVLALVAADIVTAPAFAGNSKQSHNKLVKVTGVTLPVPTALEDDQFLFGLAIEIGISGVGPRLVEGTNAAVIARPKFGTFALTNVDADLQPNEPREGGLMTRTVWGTFRAPDVSRIVIHTFGSTNDSDGISALDTVLAVYRGTEISNLVRVTGNDNKPLAGIGSTSSLVQFNTVKDANYAVQIGSRANAEGDISLNAFRFPPGGGLAAFLARYGNNAANPFNGRDYSCDLTTTTTIVFCDAKFIVHNSTNKTLTVTPSTTLGAGVTGPAPFSLAPGALKAVTFTFNAAAFNKTVRTVSGHFIFTGRAGATVVTEARSRALVIVRPNTPVQDLIKSVAAPAVQTGYDNEPIAFTATITNGGPQTAIGCHFRSDLYSYLNTNFYEINPANGQRLTADNVPRNIAAGQSRRFKVLIASPSARDADYIDPEVTADCANNDRRAFNLRRGFDVSTWGYTIPLPSLTVTASTPANGVLNVPASGFAFYKFRITNKRTIAPMDVLPAYVGPFDDPASNNFTVAICRTNLATGACLASYAPSVAYQTAANQTVGFSVRVRAPSGSPAFDADKRRVHVNFKLAVPPYFHIAAPSIAVRKQ